MSLAVLLNRHCTITHVAQSGPVDGYGNPTEVETATATVCYAEQQSAQENTALTDIQRQDWKVLVPAGVALSGNDRIAVDDLLLEVQGPPWPVTNPRLGVVSHVECVARQVT